MKKQAKNLSFHINCVRYSMNRFAVVFSVILLLITPVWSHAQSGNLDEIRQYFELRDTVNLINLEMKRAMAPASKSPLLSQKAAASDLAGVLDFLEERITQFAGIETPLKYHYIKKLNGLFRESRQLQAALTVKMRANALGAIPGSTLAKDQPVAAGGELKLQPRPYFHPIDLRTLLSPGLQNAAQLKFGPASASTETVAAKAPEHKLSAQPVPPLIHPRSPFPTNMPQKTPILVEPVQIVSPPSETAAAKPDKKPDLPSGGLIVTPPAVASAAAKIVSQPVPYKKPVSVVVRDKPVAEVSAASATRPVTASLTVVAPIAIPAVVTTTVATAPASVALPQIVASLPVVVAPPVATVTVVVPAPVEIASGSVMRPLAIMIENHNKSRPQSGLDQADMVYEMPVEGGITRFMAIYTRLPKLLGPVRSCREYFIDRALEIDALYVHCGSSPVGYAYLSKSGINSVDEIKHSKPFFRDNSRKAPHNLYSRGAGILDYMSDKIKMTLSAAPRLINYGTTDLTGAESGESVRIRYHGNYTLDFKFENGAYQRYMNNVLHVDRETQQPLRASAVIVQIAAMQVVDQAGRQEISFIGSGKAWVLENGRMTKVTWLKKTPRELTSYKDAAGREYLFPRELPVWVQVVSPSHKLGFNGVEDIAPVAGKEVIEAASATAEIGKQG
ncbi:MAG: hypothetical protein CVV41_18860 [Candidatus Riflebacteria bacterium HGW-Riflebacteria-1]|jgi:hypothetical protein|nr:MAG: hypothetical protein CVV41_18860 [Candidatus Riflebacteria bacterium HGW-Riflebacteria-1]